MISIHNSKTKRSLVSFAKQRARQGGWRARGERYEDLGSEAGADFDWSGRNRFGVGGLVRLARGSYGRAEVSCGCRRCRIGACCCASRSRPARLQFAKCGGADCVATSKPAALVDCVQCLSEADGALFEAESVSAGEPWSTIVVGGLVGALPDVYDGPNGMSLAGIEPDATAAPASEISTAAMVALGVVLLTARRAGRNRWASWKAPWRVSTLPASG